MRTLPSYTWPFQFGRTKCRNDPITPFGVRERWPIAGVSDLTWSLSSGAGVFSYPMLSQRATGAVGRELPRVAGRVGRVGHDQARISYTISSPCLECVANLNGKESCRAACLDGCDNMDASNARPLAAVNLVKQNYLSITRRGRCYHRNPR